MSKKKVSRAGRNRVFRLTKLKKKLSTGKPLRTQNGGSIITIRYKLVGLQVSNTSQFIDLTKRNSRT